MAQPARPLVSEPFVQQMEVIEKALIETQNQPASYYGRRNTRPTANANQSIGNLSSSKPTAASGLGFNPNTMSVHGQKVGTSTNFYSTKTSYAQQPLDIYGNYHNPALARSGGASQNGNLRLLSNRSGGSVIVSSGDSRSAEVTSAVNGNLPSNSVGQTHHIPQLFDDETVYSGMSGSSDSQRSDSLSTFDPFANSKASFGQQSLFSPMFNSSSSFLRSNYTSTSSNIWGNTNKNMAGDAAVWG